MWLRDVIFAVQENIIPYFKMLVEVRDALNLINVS